MTTTPPFPTNEPKAPCAPEPTAAFPAAGAQAKTPIHTSGQTPSNREPIRVPNRTCAALPDFSRFIAVTNRALCTQPFLEQVKRVVACSPHALILREKDLDDASYAALAREVLALCEQANVPCFVHGRPHIAEALRCPRLHLPLAQLEALVRERPDALRPFSELSVSCHSEQDARQAERLGATRLILGTIFETDCKPGLAGAGVGLVRAACNATSLPVFAIGGVTPERLPALLEAGAAGGCMMSGFMRL